MTPLGVRVVVVQLVFRVVGLVKICRLALMPVVVQSAKIRAPVTRVAVLEHVSICRLVQTLVDARFVGTPVAEVVAQVVEKNMFLPLNGVMEGLEVALEIVVAQEVETRVVA